MSFFLSGPQAIALAATIFATPFAFDVLPETPDSFKHAFKHAIGWTSSAYVFYLNSDQRLCYGLRCIPCGKIIATERKLEEDLIEYKGIPSDHHKFNFGRNKYEWNAQDLDWTRRCEFMARFGDKSHEAFLRYVKHEEALLQRSRDQQTLKQMAKDVKAFKTQ